MASNKLARWLRHSIKTPHSVNRAFRPAVLQRIQDEITEGERVHSGEIRFAVEAALPWSYLRSNAPARERAEMVFAKLRVWDLETWKEPFHRTSLLGFGSPNLRRSRPPVPTTNSTIPSSAVARL